MKCKECGHILTYEPELTYDAIRRFNETGLCIDCQLNKMMDETGDGRLPPACGLKCWIKDCYNKVADQYLDRPYMEAIMVLCDEHDTLTNHEK